MKHLLLFLLIFFIPFTASAQNWTPEQQEVIAHIKTCWDGWIKAFEQKDRGLWDEVCPCAEGFTLWGTHNGAPASYENQTRGLSGGLFSRLNKKIDWLDLRPLSVKIDGDVALVHFYAIFVVENNKGEIARNEQKRFEVFRKKDGKWTLLGGMTTPVPKD